MKAHHFLVVALAFTGSAVRADRPAFDLPQHYVCEGFNQSNERVSIALTLSGDDQSTSFVLVPLKGSAWPNARVEISELRASFYEGEGNRFWYWVGVDLNLDGQGYGFGFNVNLGSKHGASALRFSREKYAPNLKTGEVKFDPKGAYHDDVPCTPDDGTN